MAPVDKWLAKKVKQLKRKTSAFVACEIFFYFFYFLISLEDYQALKISIDPYTASLQTFSFFPRF